MHQNATSVFATIYMVCHGHALNPTDVTCRVLRLILGEHQRIWQLCVCVFQVSKCEERGSKDGHELFDAIGTGQYR